MITKKHAVGNNPLFEDFDASKPTNYLMYFDANNLYGWAMSQKLLEKEFDWMKELENFDFNSIPDDAETSCILEVDLEYPAAIHDIHSDLPVAPESQAVQVEDLSPYSQELHGTVHIKVAVQSKLIPSLHDKEKYVVHYRNLKQYLALGLRLKKIHRGVEFTQSFWLRTLHLYEH